MAFWVTQCADSQGAELRHVVETGDRNAADVVVVQRAGREGWREDRTEGWREKSVILL